MASTEEPREIVDDPIDREAMRAIGTTYDVTLDIDYETESVLRLDALWLEVIAPWLAGVSEARFSAFERAVDRQFDIRPSNIAEFARERAAALLLLVIDWRWLRWADRELAEGRDPYSVTA